MTSPPGEETDFHHGALEDTTHAQRVAGAPRVQGEGIAYGQSITIDNENINQLGIKDQLETFWMDQKGAFSKDDVKKGFSSDFPEAGGQDFLKKFGMDTGEYHDHATPKFNMQRVDVNGQGQGYFIYNNLPQYGDIGLYIKADAIDVSKLPDNLQKNLAENERPTGISIPFANGAMLGDAPVQAEDRPAPVVPRHNSSFQP